MMGDHLALASIIPERLPLSLLKLTMSDNVHSPLRIVAESSKPVSATAAKAHVEAFLADYGNRMTTKGGDTTVIVQLHKLSGALEKEKKVKV